MNDKKPDPLFPAEWGLQRYEFCVLQFAKRVAAVDETPAPYQNLELETRYAKVTNYEDVKFDNWFIGVLEDMTFLPPDEFLDLTGQQKDQLDRIITSRIALERLRIRGEKKTGICPEHQRNPPDDLAPSNDNPGLQHSFPAPGTGPDRSKDRGPGLEAPSREFTRKDRDPGRGRGR